LVKALVPSSKDVFFQPVEDRGVQGSDFLPVGFPRRSICSEGFTGCIRLIQKVLPMAQRYFLF
jgi:hypothetical protein